MLPKRQYNLTNWLDGMKINRQHFMNSENAVLDQLRDTAAILQHSFDYGLLEPLPGEKSSLDCDVAFSQGGQFKITIRHCRAITAGGCRIEIIPGLHPALVSDQGLSVDAGKPAAGAAYLAVISTDPYNRQPFGPADGEEYPPRNQYSISTHRLALVAEDEIHAASAGNFLMPVARFVLQGTELQRDDNYIPPCSVIAAHPNTKLIYNTIAERLNLIQEYSTEISRKVTEMQQPTPLTQNLRSICEKCIWHVSSEFFRFRMIYRQQSPVYIANSVVQLANVISVCMNLLPVKEKEELQQYFSHWNEISPGKFEEALSRVVNADYEHEDIAGFFGPLLDLLKIWTELLAKLKDLKLIGARKEGFDFGGRTMDIPKEKGKGKFSIFD